MAGQTRIDGNLIDTGTDPNDIVSVSVGDGRYPRLSQDNTLAGNLTVDGQVRSDNVTDSAGTGAPAFPNGMSATGAALTDPEITGGIYLGGTGSTNYLDDYEEGTWTPTVDQGTVGQEITATYTKIGRLVRIRVGLSDFSDTSTASKITITSLPFNVANGTSGSTGIVVGERIDKSLVVADVGDDNNIRLREGVGSANFGEVNYADINNGSDVAIRFSVTYETDS